MDSQADGEPLSTYVQANMQVGFPSMILVPSL
jgi:hypothetical protein